MFIKYKSKQLDTVCLHPVTLTKTAFTHFPSPNASKVDQIMLKINRPCL